MKREEEGESRSRMSDRKWCREWCRSFKKLLLRGGGVHHWYLKAILGLQESEYAICTNHTWSLYRVAESLFDGKALNISRETEVFLI